MLLGQRQILDHPNSNSYSCKCIYLLVHTQVWFGLVHFHSFLTSYHEIWEGVEFPVSRICITWCQWEGTVSRVSISLHGHRSVRAPRMKVSALQIPCLSPAEVREVSCHSCLARRALGRGCAGFILQGPAASSMLVTIKKKISHLVSPQVGSTLPRVTSRWPSGKVWWKRLSVGH